jgi:hypothetical protein
MKRATEYLQNAANAEAAAARMIDPDMRRQFLEIARQWRELAQQTLGPNHVQRDPKDPNSAEEDR